MINRLRPYLHRHPRTVDGILAASVLACSFPGAVVTLPGHEPGITWWPGVLLAGTSCVALLWRRQRPRLTVVLATLCAMAMAGLGYLLTVLLLGPLMVALYSLASATDRKTRQHLRLHRHAGVVRHCCDYGLDGGHRRCGVNTGVKAPSSPRNSSGHGHARRRSGRREHQLLRRGQGSAGCMSSTSPVALPSTIWPGSGRRSTAGGGKHGPSGLPEEVHAALGDDPQPWSPSLPGASAPRKRSPEGRPRRGRRGGEGRR